jgi:hypothetical protein
MRYILPINNFLNEAINLNKAKEYTSLRKYTLSILSKKLDPIFGNEERLYLEVPEEVNSETKVEINNYLGTLGYVISDYIGGFAHHYKDGPKRIVRIGKLLSQNKNQELLTKFNQDKIRFDKSVSSKTLVISRHPYDVAGMSTDRNWTSCMNIEGGGMNHCLPTEIKYSTIIAYLIDSEDRNINKPLGRINLKVYYEDNGEEIEDNDNFVWLPDVKTYGNFTRVAYDTLLGWLSSWQDSPDGGVFIKPLGSYCDVGTPYRVEVLEGYKIRTIDVFYKDNYSGIDLHDLVATGLMGGYLNLACDMLGFGLVGFDVLNGTYLELDYDNSTAEQYEDDIDLDLRFNILRGLEKENSFTLNFDKISRSQDDNFALFFSKIKSEELIVSGDINLRNNWILADNLEIESKVIIFDGATFGKDYTGSYNWIVGGNIKEIIFKDMVVYDLQSFELFVTYLEVAYNDVDINYWGVKGRGVKEYLRRYDLI